MPDNIKDQKDAVKTAVTDTKTAEKQNLSHQKLDEKILSEKKLICKSLSLQTKLIGLPGSKAPFTSEASFDEFLAQDINTLKKMASMRKFRELLNNDGMISLIKIALNDDHKLYKEFVEAMPSGSQTREKLMAQISQDTGKQQSVLPCCVSATAAAQQPLVTGAPPGGLAFAANSTPHPATATAPKPTRK